MLSRGRWYDHLRSPLPVLPPGRQEHSWSKHICSRFCILPFWSSKKLNLATCTLNCTAWNRQECLTHSDTRADTPKWFRGKTVRASHRGLAGCDAKEREECDAEGTKASRSFIAKQGDSYDSICRTWCKVTANHNCVGWAFRIGWFWGGVPGDICWIGSLCWWWLEMSVAQHIIFKGCSLVEVVNC